MPYTKDMKQTKEQMIEEVAKLKHDNERLILQDQLKRKEFAKAFGWYTSKPYGGDKEVSLPTWEQIFVNLGTLLAAKNFMDYEGNISELECKLEYLEKKIGKEIHPNL